MREIRAAASVTFGLSFRGRIFRSPCWRLDRWQSSPRRRPHKPDLQAKSLSVSSVAPDCLAGRCKSKSLRGCATFESFAAPSFAVCVLPFLIAFYLCRRIVHARTTVRRGPTLLDRDIVLHRASLDDRPRHERLHTIQASDLAFVPVPRIRPGYLAGGTCCTLHVHAREQRRWSRQCFQGRHRPLRRPCACCLPPSLLSTPSHLFPRGRRKTPFIHRALSMRSSACLEEWGGWQGRENRPSRKRKAWTGGAHRSTRSARGSGRLRDAPHVSTGALHTPQTASNASGKASDFRRIEPKVWQHLVRVS